MNWKNVILFGLGAYWLLGKAGSAAFNKVAWTFEKVRLRDIKLGKGGFNLRLRIKNNLPTAIKLSSYQGEIYQAGALLATIENVSPINLPTNEEVVVTAFARVKGFDLLKALIAGTRLEPVDIDSYAGIDIGAGEVTIPIKNRFSLFYVE
jgi:LEA14-like dessication related protein